MEISQKCIDLVAGFEGLRLDAYLDPVGIPTIGYGTIRYPDGTRVRLGDRISGTDAEAFLHLELEVMAKDVARLVGGVSLNQNQFDALVSFTYNVGAGAFGGSTLLEKLKQADFGGAASEFGRWNKGTIYGEKRVLPGLTTRRTTEQALFENHSDQGEPIPPGDSPQSKATQLEGFRDGDQHLIIASDADGKVVDIVELESSDIDYLTDLLRQYPNAAKFEIAPAGKAIPAGDRTQFVLRERLIERVKRVPKLDQALLLRGSEDGDTGNDVKELQIRMRDLGYYHARIDGIFGRGTDDAAKQFQAKVFGLAEADGKVGPRTWARLFGEGRPPQVPDATSPVRAGLNYLRLTKTNRRDEKGLMVFDLALYKDGRFQESIPACSGIRSRQAFRTGSESVSRSNEPIPEGRWTLSNMKWRDGRDNYQGRVWSNSLGPVKIFLCYKGPGTTRRSEIEIHLDWNKRTGPGTAGCLGIHNVSDFKRLASWLRNTAPEPRSLYVDWGLGTCPDPRLPSAAFDESPCVW